MIGVADDLQSDENLPRSDITRLRTGLDWGGTMISVKKEGTRI
jgi:hypothetical protein